MFFSFYNFLTLLFINRCPWDLIFANSIWNEDLNIDFYRCGYLSLCFIAAHAVVRASQNNNCALVSYRFHWNSKETCLFRRPTGERGGGHTVRELLSNFCINLVIISRLPKPQLFLNLPFYLLGNPPVLFSWCECSSTLALVGGKLIPSALNPPPFPLNDPPQFTWHALLRRHYNIRCT